MLLKVLLIFEEADLNHNPGHPPQFTYKDCYSERYQEYHRNDACVEFSFNNLSMSKVDTKRLPEFFSEGFLRLITV